MSLHFYPHEDMDVQARRLAPPEGLGPQGGIVAPIAIINLTLTLSALSFAWEANWRWAMIMFAIVAVFNVSLLPRRR